MSLTKEQLEIIEMVLLRECNQVNTDLDVGMSPLSQSVLESFHRALDGTHEAVKRLIKDGDYRVVS